MRHAQHGPRYECLECRKSVVVRSALAPLRQLCSECAQKEPGAWRTVYDRDKGLGKLPARFTTDGT